MNDELLMEAAVENPLDKAMEAAKSMQKEGILPGDGVAHPTERTAQTVALEIRTLKNQARSIVISYAIEIGRKLEEAKAMVPYGEWGAWLKREVSYSPSTAQNLMRVFRAYGDDQMSLFGGPKSQTFGNLTYTQALKLLDITDEEEREQFASENDVEHMSVRELDEAIKERNAARKDAEQARFEADAAKNEAEQTKEEAARARENLAAREKSYMENLAAAEQEKNAAEKELEALRRELEERPTVEDKVAVSRARSEAIAEMNKKLQAAEEKMKKAEAESKAFAEKLKDLHKENEDLKAKSEEPVPAPVDDSRLRELEKKLATANPEMAEFKVRYATWQEEFQRMAAIIATLPDPAQAEKLRNALRAALAQMEQEVETAKDPAESGGEDGSEV